MYTKLYEAEVIQEDGVQNALETIEKFSKATEPDQDIVGALIEKVLVHDPRHVEIRWKFSDEVLKLLRDECRVGWRNLTGSFYVEEKLVLWYNKLSV